MTIQLRRPTYPDQLDVSVAMMIEIDLGGKIDIQHYIIISYFLIIFSNNYSSLGS